MSGSNNAGLSCTPAPGAGASLASEEGLPDLRLRDRAAPALAAAAWPGSAPTEAALLAIPDGVEGLRQWAPALRVAEALGGTGSSGSNAWPSCTGPNSGLSPPGEASRAHGDPLGRAPRSVSKPVPNERGALFGPLRLLAARFVVAALCGRSAPSPAEGTHSSERAPGPSGGISTSTGGCAGSASTAARSLATCNRCDDGICNRGSSPSMDRLALETEPLGTN